MAKVIKGNRGGKVLVVDGYRYQNRGIVGGNMGWRCWRRKECNASLKTSIFEVREGPVDPDIRVIRHHSHEPDDGVIERAEQREEMIATIKQNPCTPVGRVYKSTVSDIFRRNTQGGGDREPNVAEFNSFKSILTRARSKGMPPIPRRVEDVNIQGTWAESWQDERFLLHIDNDWGISIFATDDDLRTLSQCRNVYMDGTFRSCPRPYEQFFTILGNYHGHIIPLCKVLMVNRDIGSYRQVFSVLKQRIRLITHSRWRPRKIVCDFEQGLINAAETEFPNASIRGCYFHFTQSLWRRIQELGLSVGYRDDVSLQGFLRKILALGYLPLQLVAMNFNLIRAGEEAVRLIRRYPSLRNFLDYVHNNYINGTFPPQLWNVYDRNMDQRTNNHVESK